VTREQVHRLVDAVPEEMLGAVARYLEGLLNAVGDPAFREMAAEPGDTAGETS
jgi:hypothetical protein